ERAWAVRPARSGGRPEGRLRLGLRGRVAAPTRSRGDRAGWRRPVPADPCEPRRAAAAVRGRRRGVGGDRLSRVATCGRASAGSGKTPIGKILTMRVTSKGQVTIQIEIRERP